jgi:hypothetical protein
MSLDDILKDTDSKKEKKDIELTVAKYRSVFCSEIGEEVLNDILWEAGHGRSIGYMTDVQRGAYDLGTTILNKMGIYIGTTRREVTNALLNVSPLRDY